MRTSIATAALLLLAATLLLPACQPYEDGPKISFRSKEKRMTFTRPIASYTVDGVDSLEGLETRLIAATDSSYERGMELVWFPSEDETLSNLCGVGAMPYACLGNWSFETEDPVIFINLAGLTSSEVSSRIWTIERLSKNQAVFSNDYQGRLQKITFDNVGYE